MLEKRKLGQVTCDFLSRAEFVALCDWWLTTNRFHHVVTLNPEMVMQAENDAAFRTPLRSAELRVPDGAGLIWARWYLRSNYWLLWPSLLSFMFQPSERITGVEAVMDLAKLCAAKQLPLYLLGGAPSQVTETAKALKKRFASLTLFISSAHNYQLDGPESIIADIVKKQPAVLLVAYGSPHQTLWIERHRQELPSVRIAMGVGGAFAMISEQKPRAPEWLRNLNLEWMWRLFLEPSRLPRIWQAAIRFPLLIQRQKRHEQGTS